MEIITRKEAILLNFKYYFTGIPCKYGHIDKKSVSKSYCNSCLNQSIKKWQANNRDKVNNIIKKYKNTEKGKLKIKERNLKNKEINKLKRKEYKLRNKEKIKIYNHNYNKDNKQLVNFKTQRYRARKKKALPKWADIVKIKKIYLNCPEGYEVDHIIPIKGKLICGLHVHNNLQYLIASENRSKGNNFQSYIEIKEN